jgi:hypothetical protein
MAALVQQRSVPAYSPIAATKYTPNLTLPHKSTTKDLSSTTTSTTTTTTTTTEIPSEALLLAETLDLHASHLISSPYPNPENQLSLPTLPEPSRLFALALTALTPTRADYATAPYTSAFNWPAVFALLRALSQKYNHTWQRTEFYVVIFRSKLNEVIDRERLGLLDQKSHEEACQSGGLLKYWFGAPNGERRNLATCMCFSLFLSLFLSFSLSRFHVIPLVSLAPAYARPRANRKNTLLTIVSRTGLWHSHEDAVAGGAGPWHKQARLAAREMYERIDFHVHKLIVEEGATSWTLEDFQRS